jgi:hypothetical protein
MNSSISRLLYFGVALLLCSGLQAREHAIQGCVVDYITGAGIGNAEVVLLTSDSIAIDTCYTYAVPSDATLNGLYNGLHVTKVGKYILRVAASGYETEYIDVRLRSGREDYISVPTIYLVKEQTKTLKEIVVRTSKVKMVVNGDTITYNADAFKMEEGSMLDALIKRLPGARLTDDGQIFVNGQYVQELLVNGKEFFKGNPRVALENLPSYTVNKIKVFHKRGLESEMMNRDLDDMTYVMDVRLKKEYSTGTLANIEVAGGTHERYGLKGMAMRYTDNTRTVVYGNLNNLNNRDNVSTQGDWKPDALPNGRLTNREVGFSYLNYLGNASSHISSSNIFTDNDVNSVTSANKQTFLTGGDAFRRAENNNRSGNTSFSSLNNLTLWRGGSYHHSDINFRYINTRNKGHGGQVSSLDTVRLNTLLTQNRREAQTWSLGMKTGGGVRHIADMLRYGASVDYLNTSSRDFSLYDLHYHTTGHRDYRNNYWDSLVRKITASGELSYSINNIGLLSSIMPSYSYTYDYDNTDNALYRLDLLARRDSSTFDMLPSSRDNLKAVTDQQNSYDFREHTHTHTAMLNLVGDNDKFLKTSGHWTLRLPLRLAKGSLDYHRQKDYHVGRRAVFFEPSFGISHYENTFWNVDFNVHSAMPDLVQCVDYQDTSNPLLVQQGNSGLRNIHYYDIKAKWGTTTKGRQLNTELAFHLTDNAVAYSMTYNPLTGISTTKPVNVDGNWNVNAAVGFYSPLGKKRLFNVQNDIRPSYQHSVDMARLEGQQNSMRSIVNNTSLTDEFKLEYHPKEGYLFTALAGGSWSHLTSDRPGFSTINIGNFNYGLKAQLPLPWKLHFTTDLINYAHRGYDLKEMNTDELVWNVNLTKSLFKGELILGLKAYDILGQISSRTYFIDAQGRTELRSNVIPRYILFSAAWKFHKSPKKRTDK